jgi:FkbH-like protein
MELGFHNRIAEHDGYRFRCPTDLQRSPIAIRRVLLIGGCTSDHLRHFLKESYGVECDFVHVGTMNDPEARPPLPLSEYDLQVLILPFDHIVPIHGALELRYSDLDAEKTRFETSLAELDRLLDLGLRWHEESGLLTFVGDFLIPQQNPIGRFLPRYDLRNPQFYNEKLNEILAQQIATRQNVHLLHLDDVVTTFGRKYIQDDSIWPNSHGGFLQDVEYEWYESQRQGAQARLEPLGPVSAYYTMHAADAYRAVVEEIVAMYRAVHQMDAIKLVVIDLDDTAWRGVSAEEELSHEHRTLGWPLGFIEALAFLKRRGILLAIISKNSEENARAAWDFAYRWIFRIENFVAVKANWRPKVENMEEILAETNLLPGSVLYIDDNAAERGAMEAAFPGIRVLGANPYYFRRILLWAPELQQPFITSESTMRTEMVQGQIQRETARRRMTHEEFIISIGVEITPHVVTGPDDPKFARLFELLNKTNQFNTTGKRWTFEELAGRMADGMRGYTFEVKDKFTQYGLVCIALVDGNRFEQFVMSCRVIGLGVETNAIAVVENALRDAGFDEVTALAVATPANQLSRDLYQKAGYQATEGGWRRNLETLVAPVARAEGASHNTLQPNAIADDARPRQRGLVGWLLQR